MRRHAAILFSILAILLCVALPVSAQSGGTGGVRGIGIAGRCAQWASPNTLTYTAGACGSGGSGVTSVSGTANQIDVATGTTTPVISLDASLILPAATTATTQMAGDNTTSVATDAFVLANASGTIGGTVSASHLVGASAGDVLSDIPGSTVDFTNGPIALAPPSTGVALTVTGAPDTSHIVNVGNPADVTATRASLFVDHAGETKTYFNTPTTDTTTGDQNGALDTEAFYNGNGDTGGPFVGHVISALNETVHNITQMYGLELSVVGNDAGGTATQARGLFITGVQGATANATGIDIDAISGASTNVAVEIESQSGGTAIDTDPGDPSFFGKGTTVTDGGTGDIALKAAGYGTAPVTSPQGIDSTGTLTDGAGTALQAVGASFSGILLGTNVAGDEAIGLVAAATDSSSGGGASAEVVAGLFTRSCVAITLKCFGIDISTHNTNNGVVGAAINIGTQGGTTAILTSTDDISTLAAIQTGTASNTDLAGVMVASTGTATYTFAHTYATAPVCIVQDDTSIGLLLTKTVSTTVLTATATGASDHISYICHGLN